MAQSSLHQTILITGAAKRIGRAIALYMAAQKWNVIVHYGHSQKEAQQLVQDIQKLGVQAWAVQAELAETQAAESLMQQALHHAGRIDCVVNNASLFEEDTAQSFSSVSLEKHMRINTISPILLAQALWRATPEAQQACVINILDQKLFNQNPDYLSYTLSKSTLHTATRLLAQSLAPKLRVVGIAPGLSLPSGEQNEQDFKAAHRQTPLGHASTPLDLAQAVHYLANATSITGTTLIVDGGQHLLPTERDVMFLATSSS